MKNCYDSISFQLCSQKAFIFAHILVIC